MKFYILNKIMFVFAPDTSLRKISDYEYTDCEWIMEWVIRVKGNET